MGRASQRLIVVSHRGPLREQKSAGKSSWVRTAGGLVTALEPVLRARGGVWVSAGDRGQNPVPEATDSYDLATVELSRAEREGFYQGVSNAMLWPILHSMPPTTRMRRAPWATYESANRAFCAKTLSVSKPSDLIWVQDFHLMLLPAMLREKRKRARIGWFCHIPWPGDDFFNILPWRREILEGLLAADLIGFHTEAYALNFLSCARRILDADVDFARMSIRHKDRTVRIRVAPIGIPLDEIQTLASDPAVSAHTDRIVESVHGRRILLGVDRLDYTKGIPNRLLAFEDLLRSDRAARNRYVMMQVMVPSRVDVQAYADLKREIDELVGDINGRYSSAGRVPLQYFYRNLSPLHLYAHYRAADVAVVTPLRDGMNLVAMEYPACRVHGGGVLVLSEFAGAAHYLTDALMVNPHDLHALTEMLGTALTLPEDEARRRMHGLRTAVYKLDVHRWADDWVSMLEQGR